MYVFDVNGEEIGVSKTDYDAFVAANPAAKPVMVEYEPQQDCDATFKNLSVEGDIYNAVWQAYQGVDVTLDNAELTGVISSAWARHVTVDGQPVDVSAGGSWAGEIVVAAGGVGTYNADYEDLPLEGAPDMSASGEAS